MTKSKGGKPMKYLNYTEDKDRAAARVSWDKNRYTITSADLQQLAASLSATVVNNVTSNDGNLIICYREDDNFNQARRMQARKTVLAFFKEREAH